MTYFDYVYGVVCCLGRVDHDGLAIRANSKKCRFLKVSSKVYKNCFFGTEKTRTFTSTSTSTITSTSTKTSTSTTTKSSPSLSSVLAYATHVWLFNGDTVDSGTVGGRSGISTYSCAYTSDRSLAANKALSFNLGSVTLTAGTYFSGSDFSATVWVYPRSFPWFGRIFEFSYGVDWSLLHRTEMIIQDAPYIFIGDNSGTTQMGMKAQIATYTWSHLAYSQTGGSGSFYWNGVLNNTATGMRYPLASSFSSCKLGYSEMNTSSYYGDLIMDALAIFNTALSAEQIISIMNNLF